MSVRRVLVLPAIIVLGAPVPTALGQDFSSNDFTIEIAESTVQSSSRTLGLGGAYTAIAEGIDGIFFNPAAVANRPVYSLPRFDYDIDLGVSFPVFDLLGDFDLNGRTANSYESYYEARAGFAFQAGLFGAGFDVIAKSYEITAPDAMGGVSRLPLSATNGRASIAYGIAQSQVVVGLGLRLTSLDAPEAKIAFSGPGGEIGVLVRPEAWRVRFALVFRSATESPGQLGGVPIPCDPASTEIAAGRMLPCLLRRPWELELGVAAQLGRRPFNARWMSPGLRLTELREEVRADRQKRLEEHQGSMLLLEPAEREEVTRAFEAAEERHREREQRQIAASMRVHERDRIAWLNAIERNHWLVSLSVLLVGASSNAVGMESFLDQTQPPQAAGGRPTVSVRLGAETEPIRDRLAVRVGSYYESSRFLGVDPRFHVTVGFDVRFLRWDLFGLFEDPFALRAGLVADVGFPQFYQHIGISLGTWH